MMHFPMTIHNAGLALVAMQTLQIEWRQLTSKLRRLTQFSRMKDCVACEAMPENQWLHATCHMMGGSSHSDDEDLAGNTGEEQQESRPMSPNAQRQLNLEFESIAVKHEVEAYVRDLALTTTRNFGTELDPLLWWRNHRHQYPRVSLAARKSFL